MVGNGWDVMVEALGKREVATTTLTRREKGLCNFAQAKKVRMGLFFAPLKGSCYCSCWYQVIDWDGAKS